MATAKDLFSKYHKIKKPQMSSGVLPLDIQLAGGPCLGGMYAIGSPEGGGKSTLILQACKKLIEVDGLKVLYCDIEQGVSDELLKSMGMYYYPEETFNLVHTVSTFSELAELTNDLLENRDTFHYDVFIIDSLTATATKQFQFDDPEARKVAPKAKPMTEYITGARGRLGRELIMTFVVGQARVNIGGTQYEPSTVLALPIAVQHAVDTVLVIEHKDTKSSQIFRNKITPNGVVPTSIGYNGKIWTKKNRKGVPTVKLDMPFIFGKGVDKVLFIKKVLENFSILYTYGAKAELRWNDGSANMPIKVESIDTRDSDVENYIAQNYDNIYSKLSATGCFDMSNTTKFEGSNFEIEVQQYEEDEDSIANLEAFDKLALEDKSSGEFK